MSFKALLLQGLEDVYLPIAGASLTDPYILNAAEGLGPPEVNVFITQAREMDGFYTGRQAQFREIVLTIGLNPNYRQSQTVSDLRSKLYGLLTSQSTDEISIFVLDGDYNFIMMTKGYVKKMEVVPFTQTPEVQITISCLKSYFEGPDLFSADLVSEAITNTIENIGTVETGFIFIGEFTTDSFNFVLQDARGKSMVLQYEFQPGDRLYIDTRPGFREIKVWRDGGYESIIHTLTRDSEWLWLYGGHNTLRTNSMIFTWEQVAYLPLYWGI